MIKDLLTKDQVRVGVTVQDWRDALRAAGGILVQNGFAEPRYVDNMIAAVEEYGPYILIGPGLALGHARPEDGALRIGLSLVVLESPVEFGDEDNDPVSVIFALSSTDNNSHIELIAELAQLLVDPENVERIRRCATSDEVVDLIDEKFSN